MQCNASAGVVPAGDGSFEEAGNCEDGSLVRGAFNFYFDACMVLMELVRNLKNLWPQIKVFLLLGRFIICRGLLVLACSGGRTTTHALFPCFYSLCRRIECTYGHTGAT
jgi:hypothetical protein